MVCLSMKREREEENENITTMADFLLSLSGATNDICKKSDIHSFIPICKKSDVRSFIHQYNKILIDNSATNDRVFECKTCNRRFPSFQALGGHRASHKKPKSTESGANLNRREHSETTPAKPKIHECSICGLEFNTGQALGGHMRRHRGGGGTVIEDQPPLSLVSTPVVKKSNSRRVLCLDLNLTPLENDIIEFELGKKVTNLVNCLL